MQGDTTSSGTSGLRVTLSLSFPSDQSLILTLNHYDLNGDLLASVVLATYVGGSPQSANFTSTTFDDHAATPIEQGVRRSSARSIRRCRYRRSPA